MVQTVPPEWREIIYRHQGKLYAALMQACSEAVLEACRESERLGVRVGIMVVLHTWTQTMMYHPHVHLLITGGGLDGSKRWKTADDDWLISKEMITSRFCKKFRELVRKAVPGEELPGSRPHPEWVSFLAPTGTGRAAVVNYLSRYVHRAALSDYRIVGVDNKGVSFKYRDRERKETRTMWLPGEEFLRRFLLHVLPRGFHKVRYYGLWSTSARDDLQLAREQLPGAENGRRAAVDTSEGHGPVDENEPRPEATGLPKGWKRCRACQTGTRRIVASYFPARRIMGRAPP